MNRVEVAHPMIGICHMQVCAEADASDEEILATCNRENPSGTSLGWCDVIREDNRDSIFGKGEKLKPVTCLDNPSRKHFLVAC